MRHKFKIALSSRRQYLVRQRLVLFCDIATLHHVPSGKDERINVSRGKGTRFLGWASETREITIRPPIDHSGTVGCVIKTYDP